METFWFGNVDDSGKLDNKDFDESFIQSLTADETGRYLTKYLGTLNFEKSSDTSDKIVPGANAIDFEDEDEAIPIDPRSSFAFASSSTAISSVRVSSMEQPPISSVRVSSFEQPPRQVETATDLKSLKLKTYFSYIPPPNERRFSKLFNQKKMVPKVPNFCSDSKKQDTGYDIVLDDRRRKFLIPQITQSVPVPGVGRNVNEVETKRADSGKSKDTPADAAVVPTAPKSPEITNYSISLDNWESRIIWDDEDETVIANLRSPSKSMSQFESLLLSQKLDEIPFVLEEKEDDPKPLARKPPTKPKKPLQLNISNDENYKLEKHQKQKFTVGPSILTHSTPAIKLIDEYYCKKLDVTVLRSFHRPALVFLLNSTNLSSSLSKPQTTPNTSFLRITPIPLNTPIHFSRNPKLKKKNITYPAELTVSDTGKFVLFEFSEEYPGVMSNVGMSCFIFNYFRTGGTTSTANINNNNVNAPPMMMGLPGMPPMMGMPPGMFPNMPPRPMNPMMPVNRPATTSNNPTSNIPPMEHGIPTPLEQNESSPFKIWGDVKPGQVVQCLYNNLVRAPMFKHDPKQTDFLCIRTTVGTTSKYYLRIIPNIYIIGQTFPQVITPRPQSRKTTQLSKTLIKLATLRMIHKSPKKRCKFSKLVDRFPGVSEGGVRVKVKEFAEFRRKGGRKVANPSSTLGYWYPKPGMDLSETELLKLITPEEVCLYESCLVGAQRLRDAGYGDLVAKEEKEIEEEEEREGKEKKKDLLGQGLGTEKVKEKLMEKKFIDRDRERDIEVLLSPWNIAKNYELASIGKIMVKVFGEGDPTGIGEGVSFIKAGAREFRDFKGDSKTGFLEAIKKVWEAQYNSLSSKFEPVFSDNEDEEDEEELAIKKSKLEHQEELDRLQYYNYSTQSSPISPPMIMHDQGEFSDMEDDMASVGGSTTFGGIGAVGRGADGAKTNEKKRILVIKRLVNTPLGAELQSETITDLRVINAYTRQRRIIENVKSAAIPGVNVIGGGPSDTAGEKSQTEIEEERKRKKQRTKEQIARLTATSQARKGKKRESQPKKRKEPKASASNLNAMRIV